MFNKLSFDELSTFYGSLATLEKHYGKPAVRSAIEVMAEKLDQQVKPNTKEIKEVTTETKVGPADQMTLFEDDQIPERKKKRRPKQTRQRLKAERVAESVGRSLEEFLIDQYYVHKLTQNEIGEMLGVNQTSVSSWIRDIPQKTIKRVIQS